MTILKEGKQVKSGENIRQRSDGRFEARYAKGRNKDGTIKYGYCYGATIEEAREKRLFQLQKMTMSKSMNLLILGAGSHGRDVKDIAQRLHVFGDIKFLDDNKEGTDIIGTWENVDKFLPYYPIAIVAVGDNEKRKKWMILLQEKGFLIPTLVHPTAFVSENVELGRGTVVCARVSLSNDVKIGKGCIIEVGITVPRNTTVYDWIDLMS